MPTGVLIYNSRMSQRPLVVALVLAPALLFGQLSPNAVTVTVSQAAGVPPSQVTFSLTVSSGFNKTLDQIVGALAGLGITAANLVSLSSPANLFAPPSPQPQPGLQWTFQAAPSSSQNCNLGALVSSARTQAQSLASAAGLSAGAIVGVAGSISNSLSSACALTVSFALGSASYQPTVNTITIGASQTNTLPLDQTTIVIAVTSGLTTSLDEVTGALQGAGVTGATFSGVNTAAYRRTGLPPPLLCSGHSH